MHPQEPDGLGRRRPRMKAAAEETHRAAVENPAVRPLHRQDLPDVPPRTRRVGYQPRGAGPCPLCGKDTKRIAAHMRFCPERKNG